MNFIFLDINNKKGENTELIKIYLCCFFVFFFFNIGPSVSTVNLPF